MLYVIIREGPNPEESRPVFISNDARLTRAIGQLVAERLGVPSAPRPIRPPSDKRDAKAE
jgi:hypothetical protein